MHIFRKKFKKDIVIDLIGYRRFGHNELDQPSFTQPMMYKVINGLKPVCQLYQEKLLQEGILTQQKLEHMLQKMNQRLEEAYKTSKEFK